MRNKPFWQNALSAAAALLVWQAAAALLSRPLLLASPAETAGRLVSLVAEGALWPTVFVSLGRVALGFFTGLLSAAILAASARRFPLIEKLLSPYVRTMKTVPVASFVILALLWLKPSGLVTLIAFVMVFPIAYGAVLAGLAACDEKLLEMARVFRMPWRKKVRMLYLPALRPYLLSASKAALGMAWKAGVAAEIIGLPAGSMGEKLYEAKIYLNTADLFAWTAVVVLVSAAFEKGVLQLLSALLPGEK